MHYLLMSYAGVVTYFPFSNA